jgi:DNA segregation ATPase FtsK/SpoIIIE-like protein
LAPIFQRADQTIALATAAETGRRAEDLFQRQRDFMMRNFTGLVDREKAWKETGIAPGIAHDDLVRATGEVETTAAAAAKQPPVQTLTKPPENWIQPATTVPAQDAYAQMAEIARNEGSIASSRIQQELGVGYNQAATLRDQLIKDGVIDANGKATGKVPTPATPAPEARAPQTFEQVYPELANRNLTEEDKAELMEAHRQVEQAELKEGAYQEAAMCLKGG